MARARRKTTRRSNPTAVVPATVATPWRRNPTVVRLTRAIVALDRKTARTVVDAVLRLGEMLSSVRDELPHGEWLAWLAEGVRYEVTTARRYIKVYEWSRTSPREFAKVQVLSISKIYRLLELAPEQRRRLYGRAIPIPDSDKRLTIEAMTVVQLASVIRDLTAKPQPEDPVPKLLDGARSRFAGLRAHCNELIEHRDRVDPEAIEELYADLLGLAERLEETFEL